MMSKKLYMVEAISTFHIRYLIEADSKDEATDIVKQRMDSEEVIDEFSQRHLGEEVIATHKIKEDKAAKEFREDNFCATWSDEFVKSRMICNRRRKETPFDLFGNL